jgi:hypothetical protein
MALVQYRQRVTICENGLESTGVVADDLRPVHGVGRTMCEVLQKGEHQSCISIKYWLRGCFVRRSVPFPCRYHRLHTQEGLP